MSTVISNEQAKRNIAAQLSALIEESDSPSLRDIAAETGESHTVIGEYVRGEKMPGVAPLARLAEFFTRRLKRKITLDFFLSGNGKKSA
ncbi:MAG: hypothetical protein AB7U73_08300 [Pirellulales bacterium]